MYDPDMVDPEDQLNKVRVIFKTNLTDKATKKYSEFKPHMHPATDGAQMQTDPVGVKFMLATTSLAQDPG
eukprot:6210370-Pleurochrysis_carterae.AAC.1